MTSGVTVEIIGGDILSGIAKRLGALDGQVVTMGVHADADPYPDGTSVGLVATVQEFGSGTVPSSPFTRAYFDGGGAQDLTKAAAAAVGGIVDGKPAASFAAIGPVGVEGIRASIDRFGLEQTGHLRGAVASKPDPEGI